ncbi:hypothetical protein, partial [Escherichia coli]|uniref:hypothetical protein n=1 Tax=Escherichia coli TaxID=562 RepID=UPI0028DE257D
ALLLAIALPAQAVEIKDDLGQTTVIATPPQRIVSLLPSLTETVCELGACGRLVGVAGIDVALSSLQDKVGAIRVYDTVYASLLPAGGLFVGDRDPAIGGRELTAADEREPLN